MGDIHQPHNGLSGWGRQSPNLEEMTTQRRGLGLLCEYDNASRSLTSSHAGSHRQFPSLRRVLGPAAHSLLHLERRIYLKTLGAHFPSKAKTWFNFFLLKSGVY
jgi:hypothetical protein